MRSKSPLSKRALSISPSMTLGISAKAKELAASGVNVVNLSAGEPDFDTPDNIKDAAKRAIDSGFTKYTATGGIAELKKAICEKLRRENGLEYGPKEVLISCGAKHSIFNVLLAMCDEGDEVIIPSPYWTSYPEMVKLAGGNPVIVETGDTGFKITPERLEASITRKTKIVIINSPCNPTGAVYSGRELEALGEVLVRHGVYCISDEIYEKLIYDGLKHVSIASLGRDLRELTVVINGVSKTYSMTGWRIGYAAGPAEIIRAMDDVQGHSTSNPTSFCQKAALEALTGDQKSVEMMKAEFEHRRDYISERLSAMEGIELFRPQGAFYAFADISAFIGRSIGGKLVDGSCAFADELLSRGKVAVVPGAAFGDDSAIRISFAASMEEIKNGMDRLENFLNTLK
ncbi:MAG: pyridoxal phosphate-dependent aminotransferase [Candidatus Hadarchaeales archaeon]